MLIDKYLNLIKEKDKKRWNDLRKGNNVRDDIWSNYAFFDMSLNKNDRSESGSFYTPEWIVVFMVRRALNQLVKNNIDVKNAKYLEPSVGSGNFIEILLKELHKLTGEKYENLIKNIYVIDINDAALKVCKNRVFEVFGVNLIEDNIYTQNALEYNVDISFDLIIGNPPYGNLLSKEYRKEKNDKFNNIALNFIETFRKKISDKGIVYFIVPHSFSRSGAGSQVWRKIIREDLSLYEAIDVGNPFFDITLEQCIFGFSRIKNKYIQTHSLRNNESGMLISVADFYHHEDNRMILYFDEYYKNIKETLPLYPFNGKRGIVIFKADTSNVPEDGQWIILGKNIKKGYLEHIENYDQYINRPESVLRKDTVAITQFGINLKASIINAGYIPSNGIVLISHKNLSMKETVEYLNLEKVNQYLKKYILNNAEVTVHLDGRYIKEIPYLPDMMK